MSTKLLSGTVTAMKAVLAVENDQRTIEFYALTFSETPDKQGDVIAPYAVDDWLTSFYAKGSPLPISFAHAAVRNSTDPWEIVGYAPADREHVWKDSTGLRVIARLDTDTNERAAQVHRLVERGVVSGASVAFSIPEGGQRKMRSGATLIAVEAPAIRDADLRILCLSCARQGGETHVTTRCRCHRSGAPARLMVARVLEDRDRSPQRDP